MSYKSNFYLISIFLLFFLFNLSLSEILVKASDKINHSCEKNIYYIIIDISFSEKPKNDAYFFTLNLLSPDNLSFKCTLDYSKSQIFCFSPIPYNSDLISRKTYFQLPYPFPELEDIKWDYETFLQKIYQKIWKAEEYCGKEDILNTSNSEINKMDLEGTISSINNPQCNFGSLHNERNSKYIFEIEINFKQVVIFDLIKNNDIELLQEIWVPLLPNDNSDKLKFDKKNFPFAICKAIEKISKNNFNKFKMNCYIPIPNDRILKGTINIGPFFDKLYIKQNNKMNLVSIVINIDSEENENKYLTLSDNEKAIICPNQPLFIINSKDYITMGDYYKETNKYSFIIVGTLKNGYFLAENDTWVKLNETNKDINFNLKIEDNLIKTQESLTNVSCTIPIGSPFNKKNYIFVKCIGEKKFEKNIPNIFTKQNINVDITLDWYLKENNLFKNIIISWPKTYDKSTEKNIFFYHLTGLSIRQSNFGCHDNNFDFFVYIYNVQSQSKINFNLQLALPKNFFANCELFEPKALRCSIILRHKKILKGQKVMLPALGTEYDIFNNDGNRVIFTMNNYSNIKNDHDLYVKLEQDCGDFIVIGTLKTMGMSHSDSIITSICIIIIIVIIVVGFGIYISCKIRNRIKRGAKLTTHEEAKENPGNATTGIKT